MGEIHENDTGCSSSIEEAMFVAGVFTGIMIGFIFGLVVAFTVAERVL